MAAGRAAAEKALDTFADTRPRKAVACKDRKELLAFYDFPAHWQHIRTTSDFAQSPHSQQGLDRDDDRSQQDLAPPQRL